MRHFVGLDVSLKEAAICVVDENGVIIREGAVISEPREIANWVGATGVEVARIGLEIGGLSRWLYGELRGLGLPVICIDPRHLRGLTKTMPVKTDRNDADRSLRLCASAGTSGTHQERAEPGAANAAHQSRTLSTSRLTWKTKYAAPCARSGLSCRAELHRRHLRSVRLSWSRIVPAWLRCCAPCSSRGRCSGSRLRCFTRCCSTA